MEGLSLLVSRGAKPWQGRALEAALSGLESWMHSTQCMLLGLQSDLRMHEKHQQECKTMSQIQLDSLQSPVMKKCTMCKKKRRSFVSVKSDLAA